MNVLHGEHVTAFKKLMIPKVIIFLKTLDKSEVINNIINLLEVWKEITHVISITVVEDDYEQMITDFKIKLKQFNDAAENFFFKIKVQTNKKEPELIFTRMYLYTIWFQ